MKKKDKLYIWLPLTVALLVGLVSGATNEFINAFPTADWAVNGVPLADRWLARQGWFLDGFFPGALIGAVIGIIIYLIKFNKNDE